MFSYITHSSGSERRVRTRYPCIPGQVIYPGSDLTAPHRAGFKIRTSLIRVTLEGKRQTVKDYEINRTVNRYNLLMFEKKLKINLPLCYYTLVKFEIPA